jgi:hypothetical protein
VLFLCNLSTKYTTFVPKISQLKSKVTYFYVFLVLAISLLSACSTSKYVPQGSYLLTSVEIRSDEKSFDGSQLFPYIRQKANSKWFSLFKIPMGTYTLAGKDSTKWINRTLKRIGERPVVFDTLTARLTMDDLRQAMINQGYLHASVTLDTIVRGHSLKAVYMLHPRAQYRFGHISYDIQDPAIRQLLVDDDSISRQQHRKSASALCEGSPFTIKALEGERDRLTALLQNSGYYKFHKDFISFTADSSFDSRSVGIVLHLKKYQANSDARPTDHPRFVIRSVQYSDGALGKAQLRRNVLENNTAITAGRPFSNTDLQKTYSNFSRLQAVKYTNILFNEVPDSNLLDCHLQLSMNKKSTIAFLPEGTNTAGDLGAAASLIYENRNLLRGSELLSVQLRGAFEAITGLEGYNDEDYIEYGVQAKLQFPEFLAPFLSRSFRRQSNATSELSLAWDMQNRPEFHRRVLSAGWRYRWADPGHNTRYRFDLLDLNYVYMPWISATFKEDYLDDVSNRNAILRYNYENLFILRMGVGFSYNNGVNALKMNFESGGGLLRALSPLMGLKKNENGQYTLFNHIPYAQYLKFDFDYTRIQQFDARNMLAFHAAFGMAYPYANSTVLPFEKRYFSGGANSVRGWSVRELGPGSYRGKDGRIDFINQTGDMKLDLSAEYRTFLFWKFNGAAFIDAGNIWTLRNYADQPGGQFRFDEFYKQIAVSYGLGLRINFGYFILRFDGGMKAINPAWTTQQEHWAIFHPKFSRDFTFHFAVGMPF